jgi:transposase
LQGKSAERGKARFGAKSESLDQLAFDVREDAEIAQAAQAQHDEPDPGDDAAPSETPAKRPHGRAPRPDPLERQTEGLTRGDACACCGGALRPFGEDVTQALEHIPGRFVIRQILRPRPLGSMLCLRLSAHTWPAPAARPSREARLPRRPIGRGRAGPGLLAHVLVGKYCDHLPSYRQSGIYARETRDLPDRHWPTGVKTGPEGSTLSSGKCEGQRTV